MSGSVARIIVWTVALFIALDQLGLNLGPLIAGASVVGVALGFGAQSLVRDFLSGFFILVEDQYGVGDRVTVGGSQGTVEDVNLRVTRLRSPDGAVWFVPNGEIRKVANTTMGWSRALVDLVLSIDADLPKALDVLADEATSVANDPAWKDAIVEPPQVLASHDVRPRERAGERQNPGRLRQPPDDLHRPRAVPRREGSPHRRVLRSVAGARGVRLV